MSREILSKAKRTDTGEWVEGYFVMLFTNTGKKYYIYTGVIDTTGLYPVECRYEVSPETICRYTGLEDMNGKKIWENDICIIVSSDIDEEDGYFVIHWDDDATRFVLDGDGFTVDFDNFYGYECEIVGNIFDNPELMEQEG